MKSKILVWISIILAVGAAIYLSFWGASHVESHLVGEPPKEPVRTGAFHPILIVFVLFPIIGLMGIQKGNLWMLRAAAIGMFLLAMLSFFGAGMVFLPSALLLILAAIFFSKETKKVD
jgi:hypothetical protein